MPSCSCAAFCVCVAPMFFAVFSSHQFRAARMSARVHRSICHTSHLKKAKNKSHYLRRYVCVDNGSHAKRSRLKYLSKFLPPAFCCCYYINIYLRICQVVNFMPMLCINALCQYNILWFQGKIVILFSIFAHTSS
jgi:hypothetical protein